MTFPLPAWREHGRDGKLVARVVNPTDLRVIVISDGTNQPVVTANGTTGAVVVVESENILIGGGA